MAGRIFLVDFRLKLLNLFFWQQAALLARALQALRDPYCQSTCMCALATLMLNISETKRFGLQLPEKKYFARPHSDRNSVLFHDESSPFGN